jgi:alkylhydroperoxidase family enzyme
VSTADIARSSADPKLPLPERTAADTEGDVARILGKLDAAGDNKRILRLLANAPTAFRPFALLTTGLLTSRWFPRPVQEVVILHMAARHQTQYEWEEHVPMGLSSGVRQEQVDAIARDRAAVDTSVFDHSELLAVAVADDVVDRGSPELEHWEQVVAEWGVEGAMDLLWTVCVWGALVPSMIGALGLRSTNVVSVEAS